MNLLPCHGQLEITHCAPKTSSSARISRLPTATAAQEPQPATEPVHDCARCPPPPSDAAEPAKLLQLLDDWLASGGDQMHRSLAEFVWYPAYGISQLRGDLGRLAVLLGADNSAQLFGDQRLTGVRHHL